MALLTEHGISLAIGRKMGAQFWTYYWTRSTESRSLCSVFKNKSTNDGFKMYLRSLLFLADGSHLQGRRRIKNISLSLHHLHKI